MVHYGVDGWLQVADVATREAGLGLHVADIPLGHLQADHWIDLTFFWPGAKRWEGRDYRIRVQHTSSP